MTHAGGTTVVLNEKRRRAVELRLGGASLAVIRAATGLSAPTVIGAYKAFVSGGWPAVPVQGLGRHLGQGRRLSAEQEAALRRAIALETPHAQGLPDGLWNAPSVQAMLHARFDLTLAESTVLRYLHGWGLDLHPLRAVAPIDAAEAEWLAEEWPRHLNRARTRRARIFWVGQLPIAGGATRVLCAASLRGNASWLPITATNQVAAYRDFLARLLAAAPSPVCVFLHGIDIERNAELAGWVAAQGSQLSVVPCPISPARAVKPDLGAAVAKPTSAQTGPRRPIPSVPSVPLRKPAPAPAALATPFATRRTTQPVARPVSVSPPPALKRDPPMNLTHLQRLEAEAIHIMREVVAEAEKPVMMYSIGKDSACMLRLAQKAFFPSVPPFPLLHVDTTWKFREMYTMRDRISEETGMELLVHQNPEAKALGINPFDHGSQIHTDMWKTQGLKQALDHHGFDAAFGGARRDEEKSRAKERIFSFRSDQHRWDPKVQRPELWKLYNARKRQGESIRVFPLSNWTELDIWQYIQLENVPIVPLYFAKERPVVERDGTLIMVDDDRMPLRPGEVPVMRKIRFRTLGCYPLSGGVESDADSLNDIIQEMLLARTSERQGRLIDHDQSASMEKKKQEGYF